MIYINTIFRQLKTERDSNSLASFSLDDEPLSLDISSTSSTHVSCVHFYLFYSSFEEIQLFGNDFVIQIVIFQPILVNLFSILNLIIERQPVSPYFQPNDYK